jgi:hypothetical protein
LALAAVALCACVEEAAADPKQAVISLFGAMEKNDKAGLARVLDVPELMKATGSDYATQTSEPRKWTSPEQIFDDLTGEGQTKTVWFRHQRIVNQANIMGETATVEVTFVDKEASRGYRTQFGLHLKNGKWLIYSFQTLQEAPQP